MILCSIEGCVRKSEKRGWCNTHYARWRAHGDTSIVKKAANGDGYIQNGYIGHQINGVRKFDHVRIAEEVLGKKLPVGSVVHHANCNKLDNKNENLVICPDRAYQNLIHARIDALNATGDPSSIKCSYCKRHDKKENLTLINGFNFKAYHKTCANHYHRTKRQEKY